MNSSMCRHKAPAILGVYLRNDGGNGGQAGGSGEVEHAGADAGEVGGQPGGAVRVDAAEVGEDERGRYDGCVGGGDAV